jgi:CheY-like chemotaxis protein
MSDASRSRNRVLVVDDDPVVRRMFQRSLDLAEFDVVVACNGAEGLTILREDDTIGLVLLDLTMPGMDGWAFLQEQRADSRSATIPTIILSGPTLAHNSARSFRSQASCRSRSAATI